MKTQLIQMKGIKVWSICCLLLLGGLSTSVVADTGATPGTAPSSFDITTREKLLAGQILEQVNAFRATHGRSPLTRNAFLEAAAANHSADMVYGQYFSHTSPIPGWERPKDRVTGAGYNCSVIAENLFAAQGIDDAAFPGQCVESWSRSPGHLKNMLDDRVVDIGLGVATNPAGETFVTAVFANP